MARELKTLNIAQGTRVQIITDLQSSNTYKVEGKLYIHKGGRVYSIKDKSEGSWKLNGHASRFIITEVKAEYSETERQRVLRTNKKRPHAFLHGDIQKHSISEIEHKAILADMLAKGAKYLAYNPYKTSTFVLLNNPHLPENCTGLEAFKSARLVYCFEDSVLAL